MGQDLRASKTYRMFFERLLHLQKGRGKLLRCCSLYQFYLQDTKSSNGTFVNNQRLSKGSEESVPREVCSGDIVQFGVDVMENSRKGMKHITLCY